MNESQGHGHAASSVKAGIGKIFLDISENKVCEVFAA